VDRRTGTDSEVPLESLLEHNTWMRGLARGLLYDKSLTDDVLQEVYVAALKTPPRSERTLTAWLSKVVRSIAWRENRKKHQRDDHEAKSAGDESCSSEAPDENAPVPDEITIRLETQKQLMDAVMTLREPYRSAVYQRYFENREFDEIATSSGVPSSTVRTRLQRALEQLREKMTRRFGSRQAWAILLVPLLSREDLLAIAGTGAAASAGAAAVSKAATSSAAATSSTATKILVATVASVTLLAAVLVRSRPDPTETVASRADSPTIDESTRSSLTKPLAPATSELEVEALEAPARGLDPATETSVVAPPIGARVRIIDASTGSPVRDAKLFFIRLTQADGIPAGATDDTGRVHVDQEMFDRDALEIVAAGYVRLREPATARETSGGEYTIELAPVFTASVEVVLEDGTPVPGIDVRIGRDDDDFDPKDARELVTDSRGRAEYDYDHPKTTIVVDHDEFATVSVHAETPVTRVELRPGRRARGLVVDATGSPLASSRVEVLHDKSSAARIIITDGNGAFEIGSIPEDMDEDLELTIYHADHPSFRVRGTPPVDTDWRIELPGGSVVVGRCFDAQGQPVTGGFAFLMAPVGVAPKDGDRVVSSLEHVPVPKKGRASYRLQPIVRVPLDADGRFQLGPIERRAEEGSPRYVWIYHTEFVNHLQLVTETTDRAPWTIELRRGVEISGRLVRPDGAPVAGALLHLGEVWSNDTESIVGRSRTSADGSFRFIGVPDDIGARLEGQALDRSPSITRSRVFVAAFPPDELVRLDDLPVEESGVWRGFEVEPGSSDLELVGVRAEDATER